jgi:hypothetical protein
MEWGAVPKTFLNSLAKASGAARAPTDRHAKTQAIPMACGSSGEPLLSRHPWLESPRSHSLTSERAMIHENPRRSAIWIIAIGPRWHVARTVCPTAA